MTKKKKKLKKISAIEEFCMTDVDVLNLEKECAVHHTYVFKYVKMLEDIKQRIAEKKAAISLTDAELEFDIRSKPEDFELSEKPTVSAINSAILTDENHRQVQMEMDELCRRQGILVAAVRALDHKKTMLKNEVELHGQNYFSTPRPNLPGEQLENFQRRTDDAKDEAVKKRSKKKRSHKK